MNELSLGKLSLDEPISVEKPTKMRPKPLERQIGKAYVDRAAFETDAAKWHEEKLQYDADYQAWRAAQDKLRDRSGRRQLSGAQHRRKY